MTALEPDGVLRGARLARVGVAAALISRIFGRLVGLVLVVVLARYSDATTVALYGFLLGTVTLMTSVTDLGVASLAGRDVATKTYDAHQALRMALGPQALSAAAAVALTVALSLLAGPEEVDASVLVPCSAFVVLNAMFNLWGEVLRGAGRVVLEGLLQGVSALLLVVAGSAAVLAGAGIRELLWIVAAKEGLVLLVGCLLLRPGKRVAGGLSFGSLLSRSMWLAVAGTAVVVLWRQGTVLVSALASTRHLADYVVATRLLDATVTIAHTLGIGLFPAMASLAGSDPRAGRRQARRYLLLVAATSVPAAAAGVLLAEPVTTALFGEQWSSAVPAVRVLAAAAPPILLGYVLWFALLAEGQERWLCVAAAVSGVGAVAISTALLLVQPGAAAAAWGTLAGASLLAALLAVRWRRTGRTAGIAPVVTL